MFFTRNYTVLYYILLTIDCPSTRLCLRYYLRLEVFSYQEAIMKCEGINLKIGKFIIDNIHSYILHDGDRGFHEGVNDLRSSPLPDIDYGIFSLKTYPQILIN